MLPLRFEVKPDVGIFRDWDRRRFSIIAGMRETAGRELGLDRPADLIAVTSGNRFGILTFGLLAEGEREPAAPTAAELLTSEG